MPNDAPIEFVGGTNETVIGSFGGSVILKAELAQGDNVDLQWFRNGLAIPGAKTLTYSLDRLTFYDTYEPYVLQASNAVSVVSKFFSVQADLQSIPVLHWAVNGWVGPAGEEATLNAYYSQTDSVQWYFKNQKLEGETNATLTFALSPERVGTYYAVLSNATASSTSNPAQVRIRGYENAPRPYRLVVDSQLYYPDRPPERVDPASVAGIRNGVVTIVTKSAIYRWKPQVERIVSTNDSIAGIPDKEWRIVDCTAEEAGAVFFVAGWDFDPANIFSGPRKVALVEKSAAGFRVIAKTGDPIEGRESVVIGQLQNLVRANGKVAFSVRGVSASSTDKPYSAIYVWNGTNLVRWLDSTDPRISTWSNISPAFAFDGETCAFVTDPVDSLQRALVRVNAAGDVQTIVRRSDPLPGISQKAILATPGGPVAVQGNKTLFMGWLYYGPFPIGTSDFYSRYIIEHTAGAAEPFRIVAGPGSQVEGDLSMFSVSPAFHYMADGSVLFSALTGRNGGIYRFKDGKITEELSGMDLIGGGRSQYSPTVTAVDGTDYVLQMSFGFYTTLPGLPRSDVGNVHVEKAESGWRVTGDGFGKLQASEDMVVWGDLPITQWDSEMVPIFQRSFFECTILS